MSNNDYGNLFHRVSESDLITVEYMSYNGDKTSSVDYKNVVSLELVTYADIKHDWVLHRTISNTCILRFDGGSYDKVPASRVKVNGKAFRPVTE